MMCIKWCEVTCDDGSYITRSDCYILLFACGGVWLGGVRLRVLIGVLIPTTKSAFFDWLRVFLRISGGWWGIAHQSRSCAFAVPVVRRWRMPGRNGKKQLRLILIFNNRKIFPISTDVCLTDQWNSSVLILRVLFMKCDKARQLLALTNRTSVSAEIRKCPFWRRYFRKKWHGGVKEPSVRFSSAVVSTAA